MFPSTEAMSSDSFSLCRLITLIIPGEPTVKVEQSEFIVEGKKEQIPLKFRFFTFLLRQDVLLMFAAVMPVSYEK